MRTALVYTHFRCNQNCTYCTARRAKDDLEFIRRSAVEARITSAVERGATELVLTGGEPTLRGDLAALIAHARARGAELVTLETNATVVDARLAAGLAAAGLGLVRVNVAAAAAEVCDALARDPGGFHRTLRGARAFIDAAVPVEIATAVVRSSLPGLAALPQALDVHLGAANVAAIVLSVPTSAPSTSSDELLAYEQAAPALLDLEAAARKLGIAVRFAPRGGPPPCVFPPHSRVGHLYALTPGGADRAGFSHVASCGGCVVADRCPGFAEAYLARHPDVAPRPIVDDRARRRLSMVHGIPEQIDRELVSVSRNGGETGAIDHVIRINFQCNQSCRFCFVSTHLPAPGSDAVERAIAEAASAGAHIVLSGGEPTLNPKLHDYLRLARRLSPHPIQLQTNAVRFDDRSRVEAAIEAGLDMVFVSLHGATAEVSDAVTSSPGTFARTVVGLDNLHAAGVTITLNFVICRANYLSLVPYVDMVADRWPGVDINLSFVAASTDVVPRDEALVPRYSLVIPQIALAMARAKERGHRVIGFDSMCGIPLCLVPDDLAPFFNLDTIPDGFDGGEFLHTDACQSCSLRGRCYGLRRGYAELHGVSELRPIPTTHAV